MTTPILNLSVFSLLVGFIAGAGLASAQAQERPVLLPEEIKKLMPEKINGFSSQGKPLTRMLKIGTLSYSLAEQSFSRSKSKIKILLFDYNNALIMYSQATGKWKDMPVVENDSLISRYIELPNCIGRESFNKVSNSSQILLGVGDRFYLTLAGERIDLETLRSIVSLFDLAQFPRTAIDNPKSR